MTFVFRSACPRRLDTVYYATENIDRGAVTSLIMADMLKMLVIVEHDRILDKLGCRDPSRRDYFEVMVADIK